MSLLAKSITSLSRAGNGILSSTRPSFSHGLIRNQLFSKTTPSVSLPCFSNEFHTSGNEQRSSQLIRLGKYEPTGPVKWKNYNNVVYPPREEGEPIRPAEVYHVRENIKYSKKKMWYIACMIRGMSVDEALKQLLFVERKGAAILREILLEAQEEAVKEHNVEFKSNLFIADSFVQKSKVIKSARKHARPRFGEVRFGYIHYFLCLREGPPPKQYSEHLHMTGNDKMAEYIDDARHRSFRHSL